MSTEPAPPLPPPAYSGGSEPSSDGSQTGRVLSAVELLDVEECPCSKNTEGLTRRACADRHHGRWREHSPAHLIALAQVEAENHQPDDKRGGCSCGFCVWSVEHVLVMSMREALDG